MKALIFTLIACFAPSLAQADDNADFYASLAEKLPLTEGLKKFPTVNSRPYLADCSGYVSFAFHWAGLDMLKLYGIAPNGVSAIWLGLHKYGFQVTDGPLRAGDIVFFHNTVDKNKNNKRDDAFTHIGIVESVGEYNIARVLHYGSKGVARIRMNISAPELRSLGDGGETVIFNDYLRRGSVPENLAGSLYAGAMRMNLAKKTSDNKK